MRAAKVQASLRIRAVSPEPSLLAHTSSESRGTFRQKARSIAPLNGWACAVEICHDGMLEDTNSLDSAHLLISWEVILFLLYKYTIVGTRNTMTEGESLFTERNCVGFVLNGSIKKCHTSIMEIIVCHAPFHLQIFLQSQFAVLYTFLSNDKVLSVKRLLLC